MLGTRVSSLALPLLVLATTHSPAQAGLISSARMLPYLLFALPAGALMDHWNRKTAMIICDVARSIALGSVPVAWALGHLSFAHLYLVALAQGTAFVFFNVAEVASLPNVVATEDLPQATALDSLAGSAGSLVGPGLAGVIINTAKTTGAGAVLAYLVDSVTYLASVLSLLFIRVPFQAERRQEDKRSLWKEIQEGLRFLWANRSLRTLSLTSWTLSLLYAPVPLAMIVLARDLLHANARAIGLVFSFAAVGGLIGASLAPKLTARFTVGQIVIGTITIQAIVTVAVGLAASTLIMTLGWALAFLCDPIFSTASSAYRLTVTPDAMQGRIQSVYRMGGFGAEPLGAALGGLLLEWIGPRVEILGIAVAVGLCALAVCFTGLRKA